MSDDSLRLAGNLLGLGRAEQAEEIARQALAVQPEHWPALLILGKAVLAQGRSSEAQPVLQAAGAQQPDNPDVLVPLASAYAGTGRLRQARQVVQTALARRPEDTEALWLLCRIQLRQRQRRQAYETLHRVVESTRDQVFIHRVLAEVARSAGANHQAERHLKAALALRPDDAQIIRDLVRVSEGHRPFEKLLRLRLSAVRMDPAHAGGVAQMGRRARGDMVAKVTLSTAGYALGALVVEAAAGHGPGSWVVSDLDLLGMVAVAMLIASRLWSRLPAEVEAVARTPGAGLVSAVPLAAAVLVATSRTNDTAWLALLAGFVGTGSLKALVYRLQRPLTSRRLAAAVAGAFGSGAVILGAAAHQSTAHRDAKAAVIAAGAALVLAASAYALARPSDPPPNAVRRKPWTRASKVEAAVLSAPYWLFLGSLAAILIVVCAPLILLARRTRLVDPESTWRGVAVGASFVAEGLLSGALVLVLAARSAYTAAAIVAGIFAFFGFEFGAVAHRARMPAWMVIPSPARNRQSVKG